MGLSRVVLVFVVVIVLIVSNVELSCASSLCTDKCDNNANNNPGRHQYWTFCGTDGISHNTTTEAIVNSTCYAYCGVSVVYVGPCECPNNCGLHGDCVAGDSCWCHTGWKGSDCMDVSCPDNTCSGGNGVCIVDSVGGDYCKCHSGFTGTYCDVPILVLPAWPLWPDILPNSPPAYVHDKYGDQHPLINMSVIGTMHIELPEEEYVQMILPQNLYNESYYDATMTFYNGAIREVGVPIGLKAKGVSTILDIKKPLDIKFKSKHGFYGFKKLGLKNGSGSAPDDDSIANFVLAFLFARAVSVPISRMSYVLVYVNHRFQGVYYFEEVGNEPEFLESRFGTTTGHMMKLEHHVPLHYFGNNLSYYQSQMGSGWERTTPYYEEVLPGSLTHFVKMLYQLNTSISTLDTYWQSDQTLRQIAVESFFIMTDNFCDGNNYFCLRASGTDQWRVWIHDVDTVFESPATLDSKYCRNVFEYGEFYEVDHSWRLYNPARAQSLLNGKITFSSYMATVLKAMFAEEGDSSLPQVYSRVCSFVFPWFERDLMQQFAYEFSPQGFQVSAKNTTSRLWARYQEVMSQIL